VAAASTPALSRLAATNNTPQMRSTVAAAIGLMLALNLPATLGLIVLASPIVQLIFQHGSFTAADTAATALALQYYALGLVGYSVVRIVSPAFYALRLSRIPVIASVISVIANVLLNFVLVRVMGYAGLALGTSLAAIVNAAVQIILLRRQLQGIEGSKLALTTMKVLMASLAMAAAAALTERGLRALVPGTSFPLQAARVAASIGTGIGVLTLASVLLKVREFELSRDLVLKRLGRRRS